MAAHREGVRSNKVRILVAVEPVSLLQVVKYLLAPAPEIQVITCSDEDLNLEQQVRRLQPDVVITNARLLGERARATLAHTKRVSPHSKIILTDFDARLAGIASQSGVDVYLEEELLVKRLLSAARRLAAEGKSARSAKVRVSSSRWPTRKRAG